MVSSNFVRLVQGGMAERSLSLRRAAREAGMDPSFLSKVLSGKRSPPSDEKVLVRLARCLGIDPRVLVVSTGLVPSELKPLLERPGFLSQLAGPGPAARSRRQEKPAAAQRKKALSPPSFVPRSPSLPEDLL